jgi:hypothetical protein
LCSAPLLICVTVPPAAKTVGFRNAALVGHRGSGALSIAFGLEGHYGDGMNAYEYLGSNPWSRGDPMGLSWDPFNLVDEYLAEDAGSKAAFLESVIGGFKTAAYVGAVLMSQLPFPIASIVGELGADALEGNISPQLIAARKVLGYVVVGALMATIAKVAIHAIKTAVRYLATHGRSIARALFEPGYLMKKAWSWAERKLSMSKQLCGCFAAGTVVWTMAGLVPIEQVKAGDYVVARDEQTGMVQFAEVSGTIETPVAALLNITVRHSDGSIETIHTTDEHPFWVQSASSITRQSHDRSGAWRRADELAPGDIVGTLLGHAAVLVTAFTSQRQVVFNLTVKDLGTYHVGADGVLVHNCDYEFHHLYPRQHRSRFRSIGFTPDELESGEYLLRDWHKRIHGKGTGLAGAWNDRWDKWLDAHPSGPKSAAILYLEDLKKEFGLLDNLAPAGGVP